MFNKVNGSKAALAAGVLAASLVASVGAASAQNAKPVLGTLTCKRQGHGRNDPRVEGGAVVLL